MLQKEEEENERHSNELDGLAEEFQSRLREKETECQAIISQL